MVSYPVNVVHYKPTPDSLLRIRQDETVQENDDNRLNKDWREELTIANRHNKRRLEFLKILEEFEDMWHGNLRRIKTSKDQIELTFDDVRPVYIDFYRAGPTVTNFAANKLDHMLKEDIMKPAKTEWASRIFFAAKKDGSIHFCVNCQDVNSVAVRDSYLLPRMNE